MLLAGWILIGSFHVLAEKNSTVPPRFKTRIYSAAKALGSSKWWNAQDMVAASMLSLPKGNGAHSVLTGRSKQGFYWEAIKKPLTITLGDSL